MSTKILVTAAGGRVGGVSTYVVDLLLKEREREGKEKVQVRAMVHREDERAEELRRKGAEVVVGDLTVPSDVHKAIEGCSRLYFSFPVNAAYLEASLLTIAIAKHHKVELFVNMSQLTTTLININTTNPSPQTRAHWLVEQALEWSGVPFINIKPTIFMENPHFTFFVQEEIEKKSEWRTALKGRLNPIAAHDIARVIAKVLVNPSPYLNQSLPLVGRALQTPEEIAKEFSEALGREIKCVPISLEELKAVTQQAVQKGQMDEHGAKHLYELAIILNQKEREIQTNDVEKITGVLPITIAQWVREYSDLK